MLSLARRRRIKHQGQRVPASLPVQPSANSYSTDVPTLTPKLITGQAALEKHSVHEDAVDHKDFYNDKLAGNGHALSVYQSQVPEHVKNEFFKTSKAHWDSLRSFILNILPTYLHASGFIGGVVPGEDDFHVAAWLARIAAASGAKEAGEGIQLMQKEVGSPIPMKVVSYWNAWAQRESWAKVYGSGLH